MEDIIRAGALYFALMIIFRLMGKHALAEITTFDFVLLLIIGEAADQAIMGENSSLSGALLVMITLVSMDGCVSWLKARFPALRTLVDGVPLILIKDGEIMKERMKNERIEIDDIMTAARELRGLDDIRQIRHAVLETHGGISIVPFDQTTSR